MFWVSGICFGCPEYVLGVRNMFWVSGICFGCLEYVLGVRNMFWVSGICFGCPENVLGVRNSFGFPEMFWVCLCSCCSCLSTHVNECDVQKSDPGSALFLY